MSRASPPLPIPGFAIAEAAQQLSVRDPVLGHCLPTLGPLQPEGWCQPFETVDALARAILHQQLSGKAAATIIGRVEAVCASPRLSASALTVQADADLRGCGVSAAKLLALRDLSTRAQAGQVPTAAELCLLDDAAILEALLPIRGIGRWTVQMLLIFRLGRPDVLAIDDLGLRKGMAVLDHRTELPSPGELQARGQCWAPWRSLASLALWRIADRAAGLSPKADASTSAKVRTGCRAGSRAGSSAGNRSRRRAN